CADPGDLLLHHPAAGEAQAAEGAGVPEQSEGERQGHHDERHPRADHENRRAERATRSRRQPTGPDQGLPRRDRRASGPASRRRAGEPIRNTVMSNLRWKVVTVVAVFVVFFAVGIYPLVAQRYGIQQPTWLLDKALKLGLDLKGGVHLVMRVQTEDALR